MCKKDLKHKHNKKWETRRQQSRSIIIIIIIIIPRMTRSDALHQQHNIAPLF